MSEEISKLKETAKNSEDLNKIKLLEKLANVAEKEINNDPLYYAEQHGVIETEILDITKPENFNKRLKNAAFLQEKYGLDYMPVIKKNEAEALKKAISGMNSEAKALTLAQINTDFGEESGQVFEAIAPDNPEFAVAGKIFRNNPEAAVNIISGMDIAANEKGFAPTQNVNLQNAFGRLDQALSNFAPEDIGAVKKAIVANMTYIPFEPDFIDATGESINDLSTGESGFMGKTLFPDNEGVQNSPNKNIVVIINKNLSPEGAAETYSHEGNGHALLYIRNGGNHKGASHQPKNLIEGNFLLKDMIIDSKRETIDNMKSWKDW